MFPHTKSKFLSSQALVGLVKQKATEIKGALDDQQFLQLYSKINVDYAPDTAKIG